MKRLFCALFFVASVCSGEDLIEHPTIQELHNEAVRVREAAGIKSHPELDEECCQIAQRHANWMAANNNMSHGGMDNIIASGYSTPKTAILAWRHSSGHWAWMGGGSAKCGWGYQRAANGTCYWAGVFRNRTVEKTVEVTQDTSYGYSYSRRWFGRRR